MNQLMVELAIAFRFYRDGSRVETMQISGDQRAAFQQHILWPNMDIPV